MWFTVFVSAVVLNVLLLLIHVLGPKGILLTWIPGRTILLLFSILKKNTLQDTLRYTWAAGIIPINFLIPLHLGVRLLSSNGRAPRFACSSSWLPVWISALILTTLGVLLIGLVDSVALDISLGIVAIFFNLFNIHDAPKHIQNDRVNLTVGYIIGTNVIVFGVLFLIHIVLQHGELVWAGILANVPLMAFVLIAGSTCESTPKAITLTGQHVYMLSYQIWPNMAFVGCLWATLPLGAEISFVLACVATLCVLGLQYYFIKNLL